MTANERKKAQRQAAKAAGMCSECCKYPQIPRSTRCESCAARTRAANRKRYAAGPPRMCSVRNCMNVVILGGMYCKEHGLAVARYTNARKRTPYPGRSPDRCSSVDDAVLCWDELDDVR